LGTGFSGVEELWGRVLSIGTVWRAQRMVGLKGG
jgi:hypothetical protein